MSILRWLAELPGGEVAAPLSFDELAVWINEQYIANTAQINRREKQLKRAALYADAGDQYLESLIDSVFADRDVKDKRQKWVALAKFNNALKRVVNELATVYSQPAQRTVKNGDENYQELQRRCRQHEQFLRINRWLNLHRQLFIGFRVRELSPGVREPVIDIVTPATSWAISHPFDKTRLLGPLFDQGGHSPRSRPSDARYRLWTDVETLAFDGEGRAIVESHRLHEFERMPWLLLSLDPPVNDLFSMAEGEDIVAAHEAIWFQNVCLLKESKSATKQPVLAGDTTEMARAQAADSEVPIVAPDGVAASVIDYSMDLSMFRDTAQDILEQAAANRGIPPSILHHDSVASAEAREMQRIPLRELRLQQQIPLREFEREFVKIQAMVLERDMPELAFDPEEFFLNFAETQTPLSAKEEDEVFQKRRQLGLTNTIDELRRRDPDISEEQAMEELQRNIELETLRVVLTRPSQQISGELGASSSLEDQSESAAGAIYPNNEDLQ